MTAQDFETLRSKITAAKTEKDKLDGALEQLKRQIKTDYEVDSLEDLEKLAVIVKDELAILQEKFDTSLKTLEELMPKGL